MRRTELDLCRVFGCLAVLMIHVGAEIYHELPLESLSFRVVNWLNTAVRGGVPLFFMISGALFLSRSELEERRMLRHALRLTGLYFLWSLLYALARAASGAFAGSYDFFYAVVAGHYHMWFLPAMVVCYLFFPPVHAALHGGGLDARWLLGLFLFFGIFLSNCNLTPEPRYILYRFTQNFSLDYLLYLGYAVWGWWLSTKKLPEKCRWLAPLLYLAVTFLAAWGNRWYSVRQGAADGWLFSYFSLPSFLQASAVFCFFLTLREKRFSHPERIAALSEATLGVYLIHPMVIELLGRLDLSPEPTAPVLTLLLCFGLTALVCFAIALAARRIPGLRKIM